MSAYCCWPGACGRVGYAPSSTDEPTTDASPPQASTPTPDPDFGAAGTGIVTFGDSLGTDQANAVDIDLSGRILVAGELSPNGSNRDLAVWRLNKSGEPDPEFVGGGQLLYDASPYDGGDRSWLSPMVRFSSAGM